MTVDQFKVGTVRATQVGRPRGSEKGATSAAKRLHARWDAYFLLSPVVPPRRLLPYILGGSAKIRQRLRLAIRTCARSTLMAGVVERTMVWDRCRARGSGDMNITLKAVCCFYGHFGCVHMARVGALQGGWARRR